MTPLTPCEPRRVTTPNSHSFEQGTLPTASLISKQAVPLSDTWWHLLSWGVYSYDSVLSRFEHDKPHHLTDSNRLHHSIPCSNHSIEPHHGHLTSRRMEDQHSQHSTSQTQHHKDEKTCTTLKTAWLSISNQNTRLRYSIKACMTMCILERDSILEQNGQGSLALLSHWLLLKVLEVMFLKIPKVVGA
jgi:hypothetical protein